MRCRRFAALVVSTCGLVALSRGQQTPVCGHETIGAGHPYRMSYGVLKDYIKTSDKHIMVPTDLKDSLIDDVVSVGVSFDARGKVTSCGDVAVKETSSDRTRSTAPVTGEQVQSVLCSRISKWRFRPLLHCGKSVPVSGSVVFAVDNGEFELW